MNRYLRKLTTFIQMGKLLTPLSTCKRLQVSAIIFPCDCSSVYSIGYNGPPKGLPNDSCTEQEGRCGCVHAEANAIAKFNNDIAKPSLMFITTAPCLSCAGLILNCDKIKGVIYEEDYRVQEGWFLLQRAKMHVSEIKNLEHLEKMLEYWKSLC